MNTLPKEITAEILHRFSGKDIIEVCKTNKKLSGVCSDDSKYAPLWRLKIEEEFAEVYTGVNPYQQYRYLTKLHSQYIYLVYYSSDDDQNIVVGVYDTYGKALMKAIDEVMEIFKNNNEDITFEGARELLWATDSVFLFEVYSVEIVRRTLDNMNKSEIKDERKFFSQREQLFVDLFGESSKGASTRINMDDIFRRVGNKDNNDEESFAEKFYTYLNVAFDDYIQGTEYYLDAFENLINVKFNEKQKEIIEHYFDKLIK